MSSRPTLEFEGWCSPWHLRVKDTPRSVIWCDGCWPNLSIFCCRSARLSIFRCRSACLSFLAQQQPLIQAVMRHITNRTEIMAVAPRTNATPRQNNSWKEHTELLPFVLLHMPKRTATAVAVQIKSKKKIFKGACNYKGSYIGQSEHLQLEDLTHVDIIDQLNFLETGSWVAGLMYT